MTRHRQRERERKKGREGERKVSPLATYQKKHIKQEANRARRKCFESGVEMVAPTRQKRKEARRKWCAANTREGQETGSPNETKGCVSRA